MFLIFTLTVLFSPLLAQDAPESGADPRCAPNYRWSPPSSNNELNYVACSGNRCSCTGALAASAEINLRQGRLSAPVVVCRPLQAQALKEASIAGAYPTECPPRQRVVTPETIFDDIARLPQGCGYNLNLPGPVMRATLERYFATGAIDCAVSSCSSAAFLAFIMSATRLRDAGRLSPEIYAQRTMFRNGLDASAWYYFNDVPDPMALMQLPPAIGTGARGTPVLRDESGNIRCAVIPPSTVPVPLPGDELRAEDLPPGYPQRGDFVQIWRRSGSGHAALVTGTLVSSNGRPIGLCYWTSNQGTNGYGEQCELYANLASVTFGRITQ